MTIPKFENLCQFARPLDADVEPFLVMGAISASRVRQRREEVSGCKLVLETRNISVFNECIEIHSVWREVAHEESRQAVA